MHSHKRLAVRWGALAATLASVLIAMPATAQGTRDTTRAGRDSAAKPPATLPTVKTQAAGAYGKPARLSYTTKYDEFYQRRASAIGRAQFFTHEDLEKMQVSDLPDILDRVRSLRVIRQGNSTALSLPGCGTNRILIMVDHQRVWPPDSALRGHSGNVPTLPPIRSTEPSNSAMPQSDEFELIGSLHIENIEAIEVYQGMASLPPEAAYGGICGAIIIWTR